MIEYAHFDPATRAPVEAPPTGTCDSQVHIFGDSSRFPIQPRAAYVVLDATVQAMLDMHHALGIDRGIIVQSTAYGTDHSALLEALRIAGEGYRGCARIDDSVSDEELVAMHEAGVRGARFNFHPQLAASRLGSDEIHRTVRRVTELGWYLKLQIKKQDPRDITALFKGVDADIIIDHMGPLRFEHGFDDAYFKHILGLLEQGNYWVMLSNGDRRSAAGPPWDDAVAYAHEYLKRAPERMLWASDWPHPLHPGPIPNDAELLELFYRYAPDEQTRRQVLVSNPDKLFFRDAVR